LNRRRLLALALVPLAAAGARLLHAADSDRSDRLVLVAGAQSPLTGLPATDVRRLYLGIPLAQDGREIVPLRNAADPAAREMFLQHVLYMSAQAYERQISSRLYRTGGNRIPEHSDQRTLIAALAADPWAVTYMLAESARREPAIKILGDL